MLDRVSTPVPVGRPVVFCFIVCYLLVAWSWNLPDDSSANRFVKKFQKVVVWLGLWHSWSMFAPNPVAVDRRFLVELYDESGARYEMNLPPPGALGVWQEFRSARERKFQMNLASKRFKSYRIAICQYYIRRVEEETRSKIVKASLVMFTTKIPGPESDREFAEKPAILCTLEK